MASIITGLFASQNQSKKISEDLENAGFQDSDYIMYLHSGGISKEVKTSIWNSFFKDNRKLDDDTLVSSVKVKTPESIETVKNIFKENNCLHHNYVENIKFEDAKSLDFLKRIVRIRAKANIYSSPEIRRRGSSRGMDSEVRF